MLICAGYVCTVSFDRSILPDVSLDIDGAIK
jgi:hypothetical protein